MEVAVSIGLGITQVSLGLGHVADIGCASDKGPPTEQIRRRGGPLGLVVPGTLARARRTLAKVQLQEEGAGGRGPCSWAGGRLVRASRLREGGSWWGPHWLGMEEVRFLETVSQSRSPNPP